MPRNAASERRPSSLLAAELASISARAAELGVTSDAADFDVGWTTDDLLRWVGSEPGLPLVAPIAPDSEPGVAGRPARSTSNAR